MSEFDKHGFRKSKRVRDQRESAIRLREERRLKKLRESNTEEARSDRKAFAEAREIGLKFSHEPWKWSAEQKQQWTDLFNQDDKASNAHLWRMKEAQLNVLLVDFTRILRFRRCGTFGVDSHMYHKDAFFMFLNRLVAAGFEYDVNGKEMGRKFMKMGCTKHNPRSDHEWCIHFTPADPTTSETVSW